MERHLQFKSNILGDCPWKDFEQVWNMNSPALSRALLIGHCGKGFYIITLKMSINMGIQKQYLPIIKLIFTNFHPEKKLSLFYVFCFVYRDQLSHLWGKIEQLFNSGSNAAEQF